MFDEILKRTGGDKKARVAELKKYLSDTDYIVMKKAEGRNVEKYAEVFVKRQAARDEINRLESEASESSLVDTPATTILPTSKQSIDPLLL